MTLSVVTPRSVRWMERGYGVALRAFPPVFRRRFGCDMVEAFRDRCLALRYRGGWRALVLFAARAAAEAVWEGFQERLSLFHRRPGTALPRQSRPGGGIMMSGIGRDFRFAVRGFRKQPLFTGSVILILGLGIGANTAIFSVVDSLVLSGIPFEDSDQIVQVVETYQPAGGQLERRSASYPDFLDWQANPSAFEHLAIVDVANLTVTADGTAPALVTGAFISPEYFGVLRVIPAVGRQFDEDDDEVGSAVAIISHDFWRSRFGSTTDVIGRSIVLNGVRVPVVGVAKEGFRGAFGGVDVWIPFRAEGTLVSTRPATAVERRSFRGFTVLGRLPQGRSIADAQREITSVASGLQTMYPKTNTDRSALVLALEAEVLGAAQQTAVLLMGAVGLVLLIACANVANLLLVRQTGRSREMALRRALGGSRGHIVRQVLVESMTLALVAALFGSVLAVNLTDLFGAFNPNTLPDYVRPGVNLPTMAFTLVLSIATGLLFGVLPAVGSTRVSLADSLKASSRTLSEGFGKKWKVTPRRVLVVGQVALALTLLIGAALTIESLTNQLAIDPGVDRDGVVTARVNLPSSQYDREGAIRFARSLKERLDTAPIVQETALASDIPLSGGYSATSVTLEDRPALADREIRVYHHRVTPDYFEALGVPLLRGREFTAADVADRPPVLIINEYMAQRYWPGEDPLGQRVSGATIVGVVADVAFRSLVPDPVRNPLEPDIYYPLSQRGANGLAIVVRTSAETATAVDLVRRAVRAIDSGLPVHTVATMRDLIERQITLSRTTSRQLGLFGFAALVLAAAGIFGVIAHTVQQRSGEIGVRIALGATPADVLAMVLGQGMLLVGTGLLLGIGLALAGGRVIENRLYEISAADVSSYALVVVVFLLIGGAACVVPAWRAARVDPVSALRNE